MKISLLTVSQKTSGLLIRFSFLIFTRFHVDDLSSAHVYLRMPPGKTINDIPEGVLEDCLQLVKQNSIEGIDKNYEE